MNELPYFAIHLQRPIDSESKVVTHDESQSATDTLRALGVEWDVNEQLPDGSRSIRGTIDINRDILRRALELQLPGVVVTIENQETFAHEEKEDGDEEEGRMEP